MTLFIGYRIYKFINREFKSKRVNIPIRRAAANFGVLLPPSRLDARTFERCNQLNNVQVYVEIFG